MKKTTAGAFMLATLLIVPATAAAAPDDTLRPGERLRPGEALASPDGRHRLRMQRDGDLVLRGRGQVVWASQTAGNRRAVALLRRGSLVVRARGGATLWTSRTRGARRLVVRRGDAVLRDRRRTLWSAKAAITSLMPGEALTPGEYRRSSDRRFQLRMQQDGNLVLAGADGSVVWTSQTSGNPGASVYLQTDGDLVVFSAAKAPLWNLQTAGNPGALLKVQDDGNLVLFAGGRSIWNARAAITALRAGERLAPGEFRRSSDGLHRLVMHPDGNLVVSDASGRARWSAQTSGNPGAYAYMQADGNLVVFSADRRPLWQTRTAGNPGAFAFLQADGNLVLFAGGRSLWDADTAMTALRAGERLDPGEFRRSADGQIRLEMRPEGNLVLADATGRALWASGTAGNPGAYAYMQADGNLVVFAADRRSLWQTRTAGNPGAFVKVEARGKAVIYSTAGRGVWAVP